MKQSNYNFIFKVEDKWLIFNSLTCALAIINNDAKESLENCNMPNVNSELLNKFEQGGYIVNDDIDEIELIKFYRYYNKFNSNIANITIAVTLACNFSCVYCFEEHKAIYISNKVKEAIYKKVEDFAQKGVNIKVTWYGGEPLLAKTHIWEMSQKLIKICEKYKVKYYADIVTNAFLLDEQTLNNLKKYKIFQIQTTLDGPEDVHNSMRIKLNKNVLDGTFNKIIKNLRLAIKHGIKVHIRIHINKINEDKLNELLFSLKCNDLTECSIDLGQIKPYSESCKNIIGSCLDTKSFAKLSLYYQKLFEKYGFNNFCFDYPKPTLSYCRKSHTTKSLIIGPGGELYSCWVEVGDKRAIIGNIFEEKYKNGVNFNELSYFLWSPFDYKMCLNCKVLPICMGGCVHCAKQTKNPDCQMWKYNLKGVLFHKYQKQKDKINKSKDVNFIVEPFFITKLE